MARTSNEGELSADQQIIRMRQVYPGFAVVFSTPWIIIWRGELTPYAQPYEVQLLYSAISLALANIQANVVHVEVLGPLISRRGQRPDVSIPHIFSNHLMPTQPRLCLHVPEDWSTAMYIADTIIPWTVEWLAAYEGWRATGTWHAGGHNTERENLLNGPRPRG